MALIVRTVAALEYRSLRDIRFAVDRLVVPPPGGTAAFGMSFPAANRRQARRDDAHRGPHLRRRVAR
jgi:hypothetical protein